MVQCSAYMSHEEAAKTVADLMAAGVPGDGSVTLTAPLPSNPLLQGSVIVLQAGFQDAGAVHGVSLTQGLRMEIG